MSQVSGLNWDDLRLVLVVAEQGTVTAAAATLRISHPTLSRRLRQIEAGLGVRLFDRTPPRWRLTAAGEEMRDLAMRLRDDIQALESRIRGRDDALGGVVRLTAPDAVAEYLLPGVLASLCRELPDVTVELLVSNEVISLAGRAADIALRVTEAPDPVLKGRRVGTVAMAVHADAELARKWTDGDPADRPWIGYDAGLACTGPGRWVAANIPASRIRFRANPPAGCGTGGPVRHRIWSAALLHRFCHPGAGPGVGASDGALARPLASGSSRDVPGAAHSQDGRCAGARPSDPRPRARWRFCLKASFVGLFSIFDRFAVGASAHWPGTAIQGDE
ncbi:LysR family transcriptional regulator [Tistrella mobilis]|uniref:LysR family transcriptional regulator n=1 Tax=Tistrella mobilis TaxID=171437 RepID=UPI0018D3C6AE|nr:LysR family transcriptional regulator [Tistrella mobilis]